MPNEQERCRFGGHSQRSVPRGAAAVPCNRSLWPSCPFSNFRTPAEWVEAFLSLYHCSFRSPLLHQRLCTAPRLVTFGSLQSMVPKFTASGDELPEEESAEFYLIRHLAVMSSMLGYCRYIPFLGWGLWAMCMPLISRRWDRDQMKLDRIFQGL